MKLIPDLYYTLTIDGQEMEAYCYKNPDCSEIGFGFNFAHGGGFIPSVDLRDDCVVSLDFGQAVKAMKKGFKVSRTGWNGAGMFAYYVSSGNYPAKTDAIKGLFSDDIVPYRAYYALKTAQGDVATWTPSTSDTLACDWFVVE